MVLEKTLESPLDCKKIKLVNPDFPGGSDGKAPVYNAGEPGFDPWVAKFARVGKGNPLQYSCLENPMDGGAWCPWGHKESDTTEQLHFHFQRKSVLNIH